MCQPTNSNALSLNTRSRLPTRPRLLYSAIFPYIAVTGGRFMAPFLEHEAHFSDTMIGATLAMQMAIMSLCSSIGGAYADERERQLPLRGRAQVMMWGVSCGNILFLLHGLSYMLPSWNWLTSPAWHVTLRCLYAASLSFVFPVLDGLTLAHLERGDSSFNYGKERLHGAIWWAVACLIVGPLVDVFGFIVMYPLALVTTAATYVAIFVYVQGQVDAADAVCTSLDRDERASHRHKKTHMLHSKTSTIHEDEPNCSDESNSTGRRFSTVELVCILIGSVYNIGFFFSSLLLSSGTAVVDNLIFLFFEDLGGSNTMCGITVALTVMFEIPIFHVAPMLLQRYGPGRLLQVANFAYVTRVIGYTFVPSGHASYVVLLEPLHGVTYACFQTSAVELIAQIMPTGYEATGQGLWALWKGMGSVAGLLLGGMLQDRLGARAMYRLFALNVTVGLIVFGVVANMRGQQFQRVPADAPETTDTESTAHDRAVNEDQVEMAEL